MWVYGYLNGTPCTLINTVCMTAGSLVDVNNRFSVYILLYIVKCVCTVYTRDSGLA